MQKFLGRTEFERFEAFDPAARIGRLLVTGGTGFIGGAVLAELFDGPHWAKTCFLVRAPDVAAGRRRIADSVERFIPEMEISRCIRDDQILLGGLEGVQALDHDPRIAEITHVVHSAAVTSFSRHPRIRATNVDASLAFVELLARRARSLQRFVNVGTAWCIGMVEGTEVPEGCNDDSGEHAVPYTESKITFEREVRNRFPGLPFVTARPSIVVGHARFGTRPSGSIYWVFRAASMMGRYTCGLDDRMDVVPVDWVAQALATLATKPVLQHSAYHLSSGRAQASTIEQIEAAIAYGRRVEPHGRLGYRRIDQAELTRAVFSERDKFKDTNLALLSKALKIYGRFAASGTLFDNSNTLSEGIAPPPPFHAYADVCASTAEHSSIAEQMEDDFK